MGHDGLNRRTPSCRLEEKKRKRNCSMKHHAHKEPADTHLGHKMSEAHVANDRHAGHSVAMFRDKSWLSFALTIPVAFRSTAVQQWLGYTAPSFPGSTLIPPRPVTWVFLYV